VALSDTVPRRAALEQLPELFDRVGVEFVLVGMLGLE
jgi:hypothetical protein